jgi:hypothetical protein
MNTRENFLATFRFQPHTRTPRWELGYWAGTLQRWYQEGLEGRQRSLRESQAYGDWVDGPGLATTGGDAGGVDDSDVQEYFGLDARCRAVNINWEMHPYFKEEVLEETDHYSVYRDKRGIIRKELKPRQGMSQFIEHPVKSRAQWERLKADRYHPILEQRVPPDWDKWLQLYRRRDFPLTVKSVVTGFFGTVRHWIGLERLLLAFYDEPEWIHEMMDYLASFYVSLIDQVLSQTTADFAVIWEDMCYVAGPLISPRTFAEFMLKPYKRLTSVLCDHGFDIIMVDTDGDGRQLIPLFLEGGATGCYPFEVQSHMDVVALRRQYPCLLMQGGIDKKALAAGRQAIDCELEAKVPVALVGGYIPHVDHGVPPDVSWENFCYYRRKLDAMLDEYDAEAGSHG